MKRSIKLNRNCATTDSTTSICPTDLCPHCQGTGWTYPRKPEDGVVRCSCFEVRVNENARSLIPELYQDVDLEEMQPRSESQQRALEIIQNDGDGNYFIYGPPNAGKRHLLYAQFQHLAAHGYSVKCTTMSDLFAELKRVQFETIKDETGERPYKSELLRLAKKAKWFHLFVTEIDSMTLKYKDHRKEALGALMDVIRQRKQGLTVTSICSLQELCTPRLEFTPQIIATLSECHKIELIGEKARRVQLAL